MREMIAVYLRDISDRLIATDGIIPESTLSLLTGIARRDDGPIALDEGDLALHRLVALRPMNWTAQGDQEAGRIHVFVLTEPGGDLYAFHQALDAELTGEEFVAASYRAIMNRPADETGAENYLGHLDSGRLTRQLMLETMADSKEARDLDRRYLILPEGSALAAELARRSDLPLRELLLRMPRMADGDRP